MNATMMILAGLENGMTVDITNDLASFSAVITRCDLVEDGCIGISSALHEDKVSVLQTTANLKWKVTRRLIQHRGECNVEEKMRTNNAAKFFNPRNTLDSVGVSLHPRQQNLLNTLLKTFNPPPSSSSLPASTRLSIIVVEGEKGVGKTEVIRFFRDPFSNKIGPHVLNVEIKLSIVQSVSFFARMRR